MPLNDEDTIPEAKCALLPVISLSDQSIDLRWATLPYVELGLYWDAMPCHAKLEEPGGEWSLIDPPFYEVRSSVKWV